MMTDSSGESEPLGGSGMAVGRKVQRGGGSRRLTDVGSGDGEVRGTRSEGTRNSQLRITSCQ